MSTAFRDLNRNGRLDPYEDPTAPIEERVEDLLAQMKLEEKAGLMFHPPISIEPDDTLAEGNDDLLRGPTGELVGRHLNHFNVYCAPEPRLHAEWHNRICSGWRSRTAWASRSRSHPIRATLRR